MNKLINLQSREKERLNNSQEDDTGIESKKESNDSKNVGITEHVKTPSVNTVRFVAKREYDVYYRLFTGYYKTIKPNLSAFEEEVLVRGIKDGTIIARRFLQTSTGVHMEGLSLSQSGVQLMNALAVAKTHSFLKLAFAYILGALSPLTVGLLLEYLKRFLP